jgi:predicted nucleic acid-binding protein
MNTMLVDSSAWIEYFKFHDEFSFIDDLIDNDSLCTNDLILTELLPSIIHRKETHLADLLNSVVTYSININWNELQQYQIQNLKNGNNNVPITDLIIAQNCIQNNLKIVSKDKHFSAMAKYILIQIYLK